MENLFKYCPNCQSANHRTENMHRFSCNDCSFVYYHNIASAVMVIVKRENTFLFTVRNNEPAKGKLDFPGGFVDPKERAVDAAIRELKEELNLDLSPSDFTLLGTEPNNYFYRNIPYRTLDIVFELTLNKNQEIKIDPSEIQQIIWLKKLEIQTKKIGFNSMKRVVEKWVI